MENNPQTLDGLLDAGYVICLKRVEDPDPETPEPGPYRAHLDRYPWRQNHVGIVASGATVEAAIADLLTVTDDVLALVGTPVPIKHVEE